MASQIVINLTNKWLLVFFIAAFILSNIVLAVAQTPLVFHSADEIGDLPASKVTSGVFDVARIPSRWPDGHYCILKSACDPCPPGFTQTHQVDMPNAGRVQYYGIHIGDESGGWDCNGALGTSNCSANRPEAQWDTQGCWNAYLLFCCK